MRLLLAFFRLIRWPNLVFIMLTQGLFYFSIIRPTVAASGHLEHIRLSLPLFFYLMAASVLIAAAGYIINDYFDINIDAVNKPERMVVDRIIYRRYAILWHGFLSTGGLVLSFYVGWKTNMIVAWGNLLCVGLLWYYSTTLKRRLLSGNLLIAALTAWTILVLYTAIHVRIWPITGYSGLPPGVLQQLFKFAVLYGGFAFIVSLIREVVKDLEDMEGDRRYQCNTMPIVWGIRTSKVFVSVWLIVLGASLLIIQFYVMYKGWWISAVYGLVALVAPVIWILKQLKQARDTADYSRLSAAIKWFMLAGILSQLFIWYYQHYL